MQTSLDLFAAKAIPPVAPEVPDSPPLSVEEALTTYFGLKEFRRGQRAVLESVMQGHDTLAVMPTGGGKSLCYQLPAQIRPGITIVISPLIALMLDQVGQLRAKGLKAGALYSGQSVGDKTQIFQEIRSAKNYLLYISPERVQHPGFAPWLKLQKISLFAIDESHCISQWGPDFRQDYHKLNLLRTIRPDVPILALTATATPNVLTDISNSLKLNTPDRHVYGFYRPNLYYQVEACEHEWDKDFFLRGAIENNPHGRILIYCGTRKVTEELARQLKVNFADVGAYHAGMPHEKRVSVQNKFASGELRILTATNAFGMGIDHGDIRLVVHYQMPANIEGYYQEIGRAGRDGLDSTCLLLYSKKDKGLHSFFIQKSESDELVKRSRWHALNMMIQYAEGADCRHSGILTYFRDTQRIRQCGHCDSCVPESARKVKKSELAQLPLSRGLKPGKAPKAAKAPKALATKKALNSSEDLSPEAVLRYDILKEWRKNYAEENGIPAFMIFSNKTLTELAHHDPKNKDELQEIYGFGPKKTEHIGDDVLAQLNNARGGTT